MSTRVKRSFVLALLVLGGVVSAYLLWRTLLLVDHEARGAFEVCSAVFGISCDTVLLNDTSWALRIPLAGWGLIFYTTLVALLGMGWYMGAAFRVAAERTALLVTMAAFAIGLWLIYLMVFGGVSYCPLCVVIHAVNFTLIPALLWCGPHGLTETFRTGMRGILYVAGTKSAPQDIEKWTPLGFFTAGLVAVVLYQWVFIQTELRRGHVAESDDVQHAIQTYENMPEVDITISDMNPRIGPIEAPVQLVVFSDFECPSCRDFAAELDGLVDRYPEAFSVIFKHYPLSTTCNAEVRYDLHPGACQAAWAAAAAHAQGRFWPYHDELFSGKYMFDSAGLEEAAKEAGLDLSEFRATRGSAPVKQQVTRDIEEGNRLAIDGTPTVFLNERELEEISIPTIEALIREVNS